MHYMLDMKLMSSMLLFGAFPALLSGQTLRGSRASVDLMYASAHEKDLAFLRSRGDIYQAAAEGDLSLITINEDVTLDRVTFPFVLPNTSAFVDSLATAYRNACGERLTVTSAARPTAEQPRNASPKSVHPTGMAVDFRKPRSGPCLTWLRTALLGLESRGVVEATEERFPAHFHVAVLKQQAPPRRVIASASRATKTPAQSVAKTTTESHGEVVTKKESGATYTVRAGDNLWNIARKHGTTTERIQELNGLKSSRLRVRQVLELP